jgi:redox-sensitive bicupin YhaK (pirin superfamily)
MEPETIAPRIRPVGNGEVRRLLPHRSHRMIGPFIFADLLGPDRLAPGAGVDVDAHPHIGLSTLTYLFEGSLVHRDSTGAVQSIEPGAVNWMTAGRGACHTERSPDSQRSVESLQSGLQTWVALPAEAEDGPARFEHQPASAVPEESGNGTTLRLVAGTGWSLESPIAVSSPLVLADVRLQDGSLPLDTPHRELGVLCVEGTVEVDSYGLAPAHLAVLDGRSPHALSGTGHCMVIGGEPVGDRLIWWNFVSSDSDRLEAARADWRAQRFPLVPGDHDPWIPLPGD